MTPWKAKPVDQPFGLQHAVAIHRFGVQIKLDQTVFHWHMEVLSSEESGKYQLLYI